MTIYKMLSDDQKALLVEDRVELLKRISESRDVGSDKWLALVLSSMLAALCAELAINLLKYF